MAVSAPSETSRSTSGDNHIVTEALSKAYREHGGTLRAVDGVDLVVRPGEVFGLLGPNGAGKTTTIGMLTTRILPTGGRASVGGIDVTASPARVKQRVGVVPQTNTLDRSLTVEDNLYFHGRFFGLGAAGARARTDALLGRFRLTDRAGARVDALSGGMAQRLMVARALLHQPAVLFLDEPTTGLDPQSRLALWDLLGEFHAQGQTIMLTTHQMEEAEVLCDRVAIMDGGRILALDTPARLKRSVGTDTAVDLRVGDARELPGLAESLRAVPGVARVDLRDGRVRVVAHARDGLAPRLVAHAERAGHHLTDLSVSEPTLETVFIALTGKDLRE
ncbi:MAG: ABC transporter ATP-binding protein [Actinomycetota bacterium]|nr:ABC transporter ATP-binding protein [Actinomycetota bacterium]